MAKDAAAAAAADAAWFRVSCSSLYTASADDLASAIDRNLALWPGQESFLIEHLALRPCQESLLIEHLGLWPCQESLLIERRALRPCQESLLIERLALGPRQESLLIERLALRCCTYMALRYAALHTDTRV